MKDQNLKRIEYKRHTLAHLLAKAVLTEYPEARPTLGPAIDNGFYYDIDFSSGEAPNEADLKKIQTHMRKMLSSWTMFTHREVSATEAREIFADNQFKLELIDELEQKGETITLYTAGSGKTEFTDLCRGGHCENPAEEISADSFKLDKIAGAYWRGDENNPMLTRIYGLAFETAEELETYEFQREEAKKRDHRKLAKELDLLVFSDLVGSGMPMWTPRGNIIRNAVINYSRKLNHKLGFGEVHTPNINKAELFKLSGHYDQYKEDMLSVRSQYVEDEMFLKPMNCPQHTQIYASQPRSYRDLPIRYADFANLYRDERPGELSGLTRLRAFAQDDGHIFCRESQVSEELLNVLSVVKEALEMYNIGYWIRLSLHDPDNREKYLGSDADWQRSEDELRNIVKEAGIESKEVPGEAAFYGPKLDIMAVDALGREWQISTIQVDRVQPERFDLTCINEKGEKERVVMIHRALIGSPDRFIGILIEHYGGNFPLWLAPVQLAIIPVSDAQNDYAKTVHQALKAANLRVDLYDENDSMGKKIRKAKQEKLPYFIVIGDKEMAAKNVTLESRDGTSKQIDLHALANHLQTEIDVKGKMNT
ncbi:threonine--tRNA ligase [Candidatus Kaiserbacteria bacterium]|nr:threonine--tRNA ligase [Candidatus Kaiserbacteria bacterium]